MGFCKKCATALSEDDRFCYACGAQAVTDELDSKGSENEKEKNEKTHDDIDKDEEGTEPETEQNTEEASVLKGEEESGGDNAKKTDEETRREDTLNDSPNMSEQQRFYQQGPFVPYNLHGKGKAAPPPPPPPGYRGPCGQPQGFPVPRKTEGWKIAVIVCAVLGVFAIMIIAVLVAAVIIAASIFSAVKEPIDRTNEYMSAVSEGDTDTAWDLLHDSAKKEYNSKSNFYDREIKFNKDSIVTWDAYSTSVESNTARVRVRVYPDRGEPYAMDFRLAKTDDGWKIYRFSKNGLYDFDF